MKVRVKVSFAGIDTTTGKDVNFGAGAEVDLNPAQCRLFKNFIEYDPKEQAKEIEDIKKQVPVAQGLKNPKKKAPAKKKAKKKK
jgi:hypothetical protein